MRLAFAGTPEFAAVALEAIYAAGHDVALVFTQPDRPSGRGMKLQASAVKQLALERGTPVCQPAGLKLDGKYAGDAASAKAALEQAGVEIIVVAAYGLIVPPWFLAAAPLGCLNIHGSLLPRWRGAAPIHRAIEAGDTRTGITVMQMDAGLDTGPMLIEEGVDILPSDTTGSLHDTLAALGGRLIVQALDMAPRGELRPVPQPEVGVTYAHKIAKSESAIDWTQDAALIERRLRAFDPFPGATAVFAGETVKCWRGVVWPRDGDADAGTVLSTSPSGIVVACGQGALALTELQRAGGKRLSAAQWLQSAGVATALAAGESFALN